MDELRTPSLKTLKKVDVLCSRHILHRNGACAVKNAYSLKQWLLERRNCLREGEDVTDGIYREITKLVQEPVDNCYLSMYS